MMNKQTTMFRVLCMLFFGFILSCGNLTAQDKLFETQVVKINLLPLAIRSYHISYETSYSTNWSVGLSGNYRPMNNFPYQERIESYYTDNDIRVSGTRVSQYALTPEVRYYFANASNMRGFYLAGFVQFAKYSAQTVIDFKASTSPPVFNVRGGINTYSAGLAVGRQWRFGNAFYMDWQIVGPHFGFNKGHFRGARVGGLPLDDIQKNAAENKPNEFDIPLVNVKVDAQDDQLTIRTSGLSAAARMGLSIGYRF